MGRRTHLTTPRAQKLIRDPEAYADASSEGGKPHDNGKPKNDRVLAPVYLDAVSIRKFSYSEGHGDAPRGDAGDDAYEQREKC
jgi:hypothetical protein